MQIDFQSKKMTIILGGIMGILILLIAAVSYFFLVPSNNIKVIDFTDMPLTEVHQWLEDNKVDEELYQVSYEYNETIEKEHIASQNLKEGEVITKDEILKLTVSNGYDPDLEVNLVDFTNKTEEEVTNWFTENKFSDVSIEYVIDEKIEKGKFVKLNISENKAKRSDLIMVSISAGKDAIGLEITMPDFKDYTKENIQAWAKTNLITLTISEETSDTIESGKLISQNPKAGAKIKTGDKASVTISIGKGVKVVSQIGKTQANAIKWAKDNGLKYSIIEYYSDKTKGNVITQNITSGNLKPGATVSFGVSVGKIPVANFTGKVKDEFIQHVNGLNTLYNKSAKLSLAVKEEEDSQQAAGTILSITVNGVKVENTLMVSPGSNITMVVSKGKSVNIKDQSGKSENEFLKYLKDNGMVAGAKSQRYHDTIGANIIISSDAGVKLQGSSINYTVSLGAFTLDANLYAPRKAYSTLKGTIDQANNLGAGWSISMTEVETTDLDKGLIRSCTVNGKSVSCEVSKGVFKYVTVPNLVGQDSPCGEEEKCNVGGINYTIQYQSDYNENVDYGKVVSNDKPGEKVLEGTNINVILSRGPKPKPQCPADSTGTYPECKCNNDMYDYDSSSNSCKLARATTPDVTTFNLISGGNGTPQEKAAKAEQELKNRGFTNVTTEYQPTNDKPGLITGLNVDYKTTYSINQPIIIYVTVMS